MTLSSAFLFALILSFYAAGFAQTSPSKDFPGINIKNFGKMDDRFYRGARPESGEFVALKELGIKTVIDVSDDPRDYEKSEVETLGMKYIYMPIKDKGYPTPENVASFMKIVDDPETGVFFVHCGGGKHRTGNMGALYRFEKYGWDFKKAYQEMKNYDFYSSWGHGKQKDFVIDYAAKKVAEQQVTASSATGAGHAQ